MDIACFANCWLIPQKLIPLHTQIEREPEVARSDAVCESVGSQEWSILVGNTRELNIGPSLLIRSLQIKVRVGDSVGNSDIPRRRLSVQLHLELLDHLLLGLQELHGRLLLLGTLELNLGRLLSTLGQSVHDRLESRPFSGIVPSTIGIGCVRADLVAGAGFGFSDKVGIGLEHGLVFAGSAAGNLGGRSVILKGLFSQESQLFEIQDLQRSIQGCLDLFELGLVGLGIVSLGGARGEFLEGLVDDCVGLGSKIGSDSGLVDNGGSQFINRRKCGGQYLFLDGIELRSIGRLGSSTRNSPWCRHRTSAGSSIGNGKGRKETDQ
mmetsp:Transcript_7660/g.15876  ORF Transcript_7660/g.15876 Transcript_7660/m.15876 type:complete len:323 (+) Transcript_7660:1591-2559(+)